MLDYIYISKQPYFDFHVLCLVVAKLLTLTHSYSYVSELNGTKSSLWYESWENILTIVTGCAQDDQGILVALWPGGRC